MSMESVACTEPIKSVGCTTKSGVGATSRSISLTSSSRGAEATEEEGANQGREAHSRGATQEP